MPESDKGASPGGRPHLWTFAAAILTAGITAAATLVVGVQKERYQDSRRDLDARIQTLLESHSKDQARIAGLASELAAAQERLAKVAPSPASGSSGTPPAALRLTASRAESADDYTFTLDTCQRQGADLFCWIVVRNDGQDRRLGIQDGSRLIADDGTPYEQNARIFGRHEENFLSILFMQLPTGVLARFGLRFNGLAAKVNHLALLEIVTMDFRIEFRDVPVT